MAGGTSQERKIKPPKKLGLHNEYYWTLNLNEDSNYIYKTHKAKNQKSFLPPMQGSIFT